MFWENFVFLCKENKITPTTAVTLLGISRGSVTAWKKGQTPHSVTLRKIADYFGVSVKDLVHTEMPVSAAREDNQKEKDPAVIGKVEKEYYLVANHAEEGKPAIEILTKQEYEAMIAWVQTLRRNTNKDL